ncbi:MAG: NINE protein [Ruminococcaceae bacterium]|nr:NINE protein [Oscillospiraceae bacterium]
MTDKNKTLTLILCVLFGYLGMHRFYVGKNKSGIVWLLTGGLCGIGWIIDIILICTDKFDGVTGTQNTSVSQPIQQPLQSKSASIPQPVQPPTAPMQETVQVQTPQPQAAPIPKAVQVQIPQPQTAPIPKAVQAQVPQQQAAPTLVSTYVPMPCFLPITDGKGLKYEYENDLCMINTTAAELNAELGGEVTFKQEPENANDANAVAVWQNERKLGYIYRGQSQEMANRWLKSNDPLMGFISHVDIVQNKVKYKIGFYRPLEEMEKGKFKLAGIRQKDNLGDLRQDNLECCKEGETLSIEFDDETEKYIVWGGGGEIGVLPKKAEDFLGSKDRAVGILTKMECDDDGKYNAEVEVYI